MHRGSSPVVVGRHSGRRSNRSQLACRALVGVIVAALLGAAAAQAQERPGWVLTGDAREAYVEAYSFPGGVAQVDTGIFVLCDDQAPSGLNVVLWTGSFGVQVAEQVDGLVRRDQDAVRRHPFLVFGAASNRATPQFFEDVDLFLDDVRRGGSVAIRLLLLPGVPEASQPTYMYDVSGFEAIEAQLACRATPDPFAAPAQSEPVVSAASPDPFGSAAPSTPAAPSPRASPRASAPSAPSSPPAPSTPSAPSSPSAPSAPPAPSAPSTPSSPSAPSTPSAPVGAAAERGIDWVYIAEDTMVLTGNSSYGLAVACLDDLPIVLLSDVVGGTLPAGEFDVRFSFDDATTYTFLEIEPGFYAAFQEDLDGLDGLFIALGIMVSFDKDVIVTQVSGGSARELLRVAGGLPFMLEYESLPCAAE